MCEKGGHADEADRSLLGVPSLGCYEPKLSTKPLIAAGSDVRRGGEKTPNG